MKNLRKKFSGDNAAKLSLLGIGFIKFIMVMVVVMAAVMFIMEGLGVSDEIGEGIGLSLVYVISIVISELFGFFESNKIKTSFRKLKWPSARSWLKFLSLAIVFIVVDQLFNMSGIFGAPHAESIYSSVSIAIFFSYVMVKSQGVGSNSKS